MGFNTVAVLYNDQADRIAEDPTIGHEIARAMRRWSVRDRDSLATWFGAGMVVSQAHADYSQVVVVGRNTGKPLAECADLDWYVLDQLKEALERHGYRVTKRRKPKAT